MADHRTSSSSSRRSKTSDDAIGNFIIGSEIGKGSFAQVYMGRHKVRQAQHSPSVCLAIIMAQFTLYPLPLPLSFMTIAFP